jgi:hypothetical protein
MNVYQFKARKILEQLLDDDVEGAATSLLCVEPRKRELVSQLVADLVSVEQCYTAEWRVIDAFVKDCETVVSVGNRDYASPDIVQGLHDLSEVIHGENFCMQLPLTTTF